MALNVGFIGLGIMSKALWRCRGNRGVNTKSSG
jgi:hypothetical protein